MFSYASGLRCAVLIGGVFLLLGAGPVASALAQSPRTLPRLDGEVRLDGRVTEVAWDNIEPLPLTMYQPTYEGGIRERTEIEPGHTQDVKIDTTPNVTSAPFPQKVSLLWSW
jgi:hypothetical protein